VGVCGVCVVFVRGVCVCVVCTAFPQPRIVLAVEESKVCGAPSEVDFAPSAI